MNREILETDFVQVQDGTSRLVAGAVPCEEHIILNVNAMELVGLMCTPTLLEELALGFLHNERLITGMEQVADLRVCGSGRCVDVWLYKDIDPPALRTITSGCSGGTTFEGLVDVHRPVTSDLCVTPDQVRELMRQLQSAANLYRQAQGIHASALSEGTGLACVAEDVGRHNTIDKLTGIRLRQGLSMRDGILLTSGRVSSEMLGKAAQAGVPVVVSRTSPTSLSIALARAWNITLIGYARGQGFRVYTGARRVAGLDDEIAPGEPPDTHGGSR